MSTDHRITEQELAEIEARTEAATPGPWDRAEGAHARFRGAEDEIGAPRTVLSASRYPGQEGLLFCGDEDATFIAAARTDVPHLVAEVRRLTAERDAARAQLCAIDSISEEAWEDGEAATWVYKIRNGEPLDGMPTQEEYEASFCSTRP